MQNTAHDKQLRQVSIDLLECIAILLVVTYHSLLYSDDIINEPSILHYIRYFFRTILSTCVPLFFFANGFLLFSKELNLKKHIYKIIHLIFLWGVWGIGKIIIIMLIKNESLTFVEIIKTLWSLKQGWINSLWFLGTLVCVYILFPLIKATYDHSKKTFLYFIIVCFILTFGNILVNQGVTIFLNTMLHKNTAIYGANCFNIFNPFRGIHGYAFVYFCIGGYFNQIKEKILKVKPLKRNLISIIVMLISCFGLWGIGIFYSKSAGRLWDIVWAGYDSIFTLINVICIYILCLNLKKDIAVIRTISSNTLGIYLMHEIFIHLTRKYIIGYAGLCNMPFSILYSVAIMIICLFISLAMKKIPLIKRLVS